MLSRFLPFFIFIFSALGILVQYMHAGALPGDVGDGRFNRYILEHFYLSLSGKTPSFIDAPFFYPWVKTVLFSDTYWGNGFFYALFRTSLFHFTPEKAYLSWFFIGFVLNYWISYAVNRTLGLRYLGAAMGAFFFTFSLAVLAQDGHPQLLYRFYVPLAFWSFHTFLRERDLRLLVLTVLFIALQFLISVYIGLFLFYFLISYFIAYCFFSKNIPHCYLKKQSLSEKTMTLFIFIIALFFFILFAKPYFEINYLYGFHRDWGEIKQLLPRFQSYFMGSTSSFWFSENFEIFKMLPCPQEQHLFMGIGGLILLLYAIFSKTFIKKYEFSCVFLVTSGLMILLTLCVDYQSFYVILTYLPGISSVRAVSRIILVLVFPLGFVIGQVLDDLALREFKWINTGPLIFVLCLLIIMDSVFAFKHRSYTREWNERIKILEAKIKVPLQKESILVLKDAEPIDNANALDAMIFAQIKGIKTMNGYSGNAPSGYNYMRTCQDVFNNIKAAEKFYREKQGIFFKVNVDKLVFVGFDGDCKKIKS